MEMYGKTKNQEEIKNKKEEQEKTLASTILLTWYSVYSNVYVQFDFDFDVGVWPWHITANPLTICGHQCESEWHIHVIEGYCRMTVLNFDHKDYTLVLAVNMLFWM